MKYFLKSVATFSFWRYALFSTEAIATLLASVGALYLLMELMDFLSIYTKDRYSKYAIVPIVLVSILFVLFTRRPVSRVRYKIPQKDYVVVVKIGDLFQEDGDVVISTNTTFDTDMSGGLISPESLQGQAALKLFSGNTTELDGHLNAALEGVEFKTRENAPGKKNEYPIGTTAKIAIGGRNYYFVAMSRLNEHGTSASSLREVEDALAGLWLFVSQQGELRTLVVPLMGTGRGRIDVPRRKMVERIAQSFADASKTRIFSNKLSIIVRPEDAEKFGVNLFEIKDYLTRSLHV